MLKKILIVEDSLLLRTMLHDTLKKAGFLVYDADNGRSGLTSVKEMTPDIIVLDVIMPVMDGMTMYDELRKQDWGKHIPVIMLTTSEDEAVLNWIKEHALSHIKKDNEMAEQIVARVNELLGVTITNNTNP